MAEILAPIGWSLFPDWIFIMYRHCAICGGVNSRFATIWSERCMNISDVVRVEPHKCQTTQRRKDYAANDSAR